MKSYKVLISIVLIFFSIGLWGQKSFKAGYVVTSHNENISGFINTKNLDINSKLVEFRKDINSEIIKYNPTEIKFFNVSKRNFTGGIFEIEKTILGKLSDDNQTASDTLFLELLVSGDLKLLTRVSGDKKIKFYVQKGNARLSELVNSGGLHSNLKHNKPRLKLYQQQLLTLMSDVKDVEPLINSVEFKKKSLTRLFAFYNSRRKLSIPVKSKRVISLSAVAGVAHVNYDLSDIIKSELGKTQELIYRDKNPSYYSPVIGLSFIAPRYGSKKRLIFYHELSLFQEKYNFAYTGKVRDLYYTDYKYNINDKVLVYKLLPRYNLLIPGSRVKPFFEAGIAIAIKHFSNSEAYKDEHFYTQLTHVNLYPPYYGGGFVVGTGMFIGRFLAELNYEQSDHKTISLKIGVKLL